MRDKRDPSVQDTSQAMRTKLLGELREVSVQMDANESFFNAVSDPDLTEYAVYQHRALLARYRFLLTEVRRLDALSRAEISSAKESVKPTSAAI